MGSVLTLNKHNFNVIITVSVVLHKTPPALIKSVIDTLRKESVSRIFIVDNSPDDSLRHQIPGDENIEYSHVENKGYGNAHNHAIRKAEAMGSRYHLVLNPDVRWEGAILDSLTEVMEQRGDCGLIQPKICNPDKTLQHTCRLLPSPADVIFKRFLPAGWTKKRMDRYLLPDSAYETEFNAVYMQGSFMLFRMDALKDTGLFDERFFMYPEDIDITRRIRKRYAALYYPGISITHDHAASSQKFGKMMWIHIVNMIKYFNKWGWIFDAERKKLNRQLLKEIGFVG